MAVRHPSAPDVQIDMPAAYNNMIADTPHTTQAPDRRANRRTKAQPRAPSLSARHISPDTPPTRARTITNQIGISASACCSFVIALPHKRKNPAQWPGLVWWCVPLLAVAPIEDNYFLQVDSDGSKPVLMPPGQCVGYVLAMSVNIFISASSAYGAALPAPLFRIKVGQLHAAEFGALPYFPTFINLFSRKERKLKTRMRAHGA